MASAVYYNRRENLPSSNIRLADDFVTRLEIRAKKICFFEHPIPPGGIIKEQTKKGQEMKKNPSHKDNLVALRRIEGQVRGVQRMVEDGKYCIDILNQIYAIKGALGKIEERILERHFQHCVTQAVRGRSENEKQQKLDEILKLIHKTRRG